MSDSNSKANNNLNFSDVSVCLVKQKIFCSNHSTRNYTCTKHNIIKILPGEFSKGLGAVVDPD